MKIELKCIEDFVKEQQEQDEKERMADFLQKLQNCIYVNVGLTPKDIESIIYNTDINAKSQTITQFMGDIAKVKEIVNKDVKARFEAGLQDIDDILLHYKYYRVKIYYLALLAEKLLQQNKALSDENTRLAAIAKPKLDGLEKYRNEIRQTETKKIKDQVMKGVSSLLDRQGQIMVEKYFNKLEKGE